MKGITSVEAPLGSDNSRILFDEHPFSEIAERYGSHYETTLFNPLENPLATQDLVDLRNEWRDAGATVVFTSGVYDLLHPDHKGYLLHAKLAAAEAHYMYNHDQVRPGWTELEMAQKRDLSDRYLAEGLIKLIVSVDGDLNVAERKENKGGSPRPITGWDTRARSVADLTVSIQEHLGNLRLPLADAVTIHGVPDFDQNSPHASLFELAALLQPDVWSFFEESDDVEQTAPHIPALGKTALRCIRMGDDSWYFRDSIIGKFKTSSIVRRVKGEA